MMVTIKEEAMLDIDIFHFFLIGLASFRLTRLFVYDKITEFIRNPFLREITEIDESGQEIIYTVPEEKGIRRFMGELLSCHWCTGVWVSAFLVCFYLLYPSVAFVFILIFSISALGSGIETYIQKLIN